MTNLSKLPTWADEKNIYAVIETPRGSTCKLEFDPELKVFTLAKPLMVGLTYPYDWGFIPSTQAEDGDPLDVLIIHVSPDVSGRRAPMPADRNSRNPPEAQRQGGAQRSHLRCARALAVREQS